MVDDNWENIEDEDQDEGGEAEHPANPATTPQAPPEMVTVPISKEERLNMSVRLTLLMFERKGYKEDVLKLNRKCKNLDKEIEALATAVRTNCKEVPANEAQQDLLRQAGEGVGGDAAAQSFKDLAEKAAADLAASEGPKEPPEWQPFMHSEDCPVKLNPLETCSCGFAKGQEDFEASEEELAKQSGRKPRGKRAA